MKQPTEKSDEDSEGYTEIFAWGADCYGQLGLGGKQTGRCYPTPRFCSFNIVIRMVACGEEHSAFITGRGQIFTVGSNSEGRLGLGDRSMTQSSTPCMVEALSRLNAVHVACGWGHTAAVIDNGDLYTWGVGEYGALGVADPESQWFPVKVTFPGKQKVVAVSASCGTRHSAIVDDKGRLFVCGSGDAGQLGTGSREKELLPRLVTSIPDLVAQAACGIFHTVVLTKAGKVYTMGGNNFGQLGTGTKRSSAVPARLKELEPHVIAKVAAGHHSAAVSDRGELFIWGTGVFGEFLAPTAFGKFATPVAEVSVGGSFGAAVDRDGTAYTWGSNASGELGVGDFDSRTVPQVVRALQGKTVLKMACGGAYAIALGKTVLPGQAPPPQASTRGKNPMKDVSPHGRDLPYQGPDPASSGKKGYTAGRRPQEEDKPKPQSQPRESRPIRAPEEMDRLKDELIVSLKGEQQKRRLLEQQIEDLERTKTGLMKREAAMTLEKGGDSATYKERLAAIEKQIDEERGRAMQLIKTLQDEQARINNLDNSKFALEQKVNSLEKEGASLKDENMRLRGERISQKSGENSRLSELLKEYEDKIEHEVEEKNRIMQEKQKEINALRDTLPRLNSTIKEMEADKAKLEEYYKAEMQKLRELIEEEQGKIAQEEEVKTELLGVHDKNLAQAASLKRVLDQTMAKRDGLNKEIKSCQNDIEQLQAQARDKDRELDDERVKADNLRKVIKSKEDELNALKIAYTEKESQGMEEINKLKQAINDKAYDNEDILNRINVKQIEIDTLNKDVVAWKQVAENVKIENEALQKVIAALEDKNRQLADSLNSQLQERNRESEQRTVTAIKNSQSPMKIRKILSGEQHINYSQPMESPQPSVPVPSATMPEAPQTEPKGSHDQLVHALEIYGQESLAVEAPDEGKPLEPEENIKDPYVYEREMLGKFESGTPSPVREPEPELPESTQKLVSTLKIDSPIRKRVATESVSPAKNEPVTTIECNIAN